MSATTSTIDFMFDRAAECMPRPQLAALQLERLKKQAELAYAKVPYVRTNWDAAQARPDQIKSLDDIRRFPFATKADMRETYPFGLFAVAARTVGARACLLPGTTGKATRSSATPRATSISGPA